MTISRLLPTPWRAFVRSLPAPVAAGATGAVAGLAGGVVFGLAMWRLGALDSVAALIRSEGNGVGFAVHMGVAAAIGAGFGLLVYRQHATATEKVWWGLVYGALWWFLGPLTLMPWILRRGLSWDLGPAQTAFPSLIGHLAYGGATAIAYATLTRRRHGASPRGQGAEAGSPRPSAPAPAVRALAGATAGALAASLLARVDGGATMVTLVGGPFGAEATGALPPPGVALWPWLPVAMGGLVGLALPILNPHGRDGAGIAVVRGLAFGFALWTFLALTVGPLLAQGRLAWSIADAQAGFGAFVGSLLYGSLAALLYERALAGRSFMLDDPAMRFHEEGPGAETLASVLRGVAAGTVGGAFFALVLARSGMLPQVAALIGADSALTGTLVHVFVSVLIGAGYGLLFHRQTFDPGSAMGWGLAYGFVWWLAGPLTLMPLLLGAAPDWSMAMGPGLLVSLVGHLAYGAAVGLTYYGLEERSVPWWIPRSEMESLRVARRRTQLLGAAPALWSLVVLVALVVPLLVVGTGE